MAAELHDSVGHDLTAIIALSEGLAGAAGDAELDDAIAAINALAHTHNVEMPITQAVYGVCHQGLAVIDMVAALMGRTKKSE